MPHTTYTSKKQTNKRRKQNGRQCRACCRRRQLVQPSTAATHGPQRLDLVENVAWPVPALRRRCHGRCRGVGCWKDKHTTGQFTDEQQTMYPCAYVKRDGNQKAITNKTAWKVLLAIFKLTDDWWRNLATFLYLSKPKTYFMYHQL